MSNAIHRLGVGLAGVALSAFVVLAFAAPSAAKIVEFDSLFKAGLGDGGNPPTTVSNQPNGLPLCSKGLITHLNISGAGHGFVEVSSGAAPQSIMEVRPFRYGTPGPLGPSPTFSMMAVPTTQDQNGAASFFSSTCMLSFPPAFLPAILNARTHSSFGAFPANTTFKLTSTATIGGGSALRQVLGTAEEQHTLAGGNGPGNFSVSVNSTFTQFLSGAAGTNTFGGGFRATGGGRVNLNVNLAPGVTGTGYWLSGPRVVGHNRTGAPSATAGARQTQLVTQSGTFTTNIASNMIPVLLKVWNMPFTTGAVHAEDHGGQFVTIRDAVGNDARTSMGEMGTLLLVSPWTANLAALNLYFGGTGELEFTFLPEPGPTALFAAGVLGVFALHFAIRRRK